ncbi:hypothetical protein [Bradyrhizobium sp. USDA 4350]
MAIAAATYFRGRGVQRPFGFVCQRELGAFEQFAGADGGLVAGGQGGARDRSQHEQLALQPQQAVVQLAQYSIQVPHVVLSGRWTRLPYTVIPDEILVPATHHLVC